jgi:mevalonate kinase
VVSLSREPDHPLALAVRLALEDLKASPLNLSLRLESNVPVASGLGSGAAVSAALMRAVASLFMAVPDPARLSALVYEVEKVHHGTPSGIDNTVVVYRRPIYFRKGLPPEFPQLASDLLLLLADSGEGSLRHARPILRGSSPPWVRSAIWWRRPVPPWSGATKRSWASCSTAIMLPCSA